ncbi:unnamed protein product [Trifolium pratense]|uniref:Uncharacterized protein n=1 Tax=Trifolium pratense TaxID=57577 RepID=A0ACB0J4R2_TRIPR|nr:unnamed protein product [Trifolium pratense]
MASAVSSLLMPSDDVNTAITEFARRFNHSYYQPLQLAILKGDWKSTKAFLDNDPTALTAKVTIHGRTALHVAAVGAQWKLVEKLVQHQHMPANMLAELDLMGCTCLHYVAMGESVNTAKALVAKKPSLTQVTDLKGFTPLIYSITSRRCKEMIWYFVLNTTDESPSCPFSGPSANQLVALLTGAGFHDITMYLLHRYPNLATISDSNGSSIILNVLSKLPSHFQSGQNLGLLFAIILRSILLKHEYGNIMWTATYTLLPGLKQAIDMKLRHVYAVILTEFVISRASTMNSNDYPFWQSFVSPEIIFSATSSGIVEILETCFQFFPDLVWTHIPNEGNVIQIAIKNRQEKVFRFLCKMPIICQLLVLAIDESNNTASHLAARFTSKIESTSGEALQMIRELQWFQEIEKLDDPLHKQVKNNDDKTASQVFMKEHKPLIEEGKKWIKDRSNSCMVVATLIATITFAAAITVPGGNNQDKGTPIFLPNHKFGVFMWSNAVAFFSSLTSLLVFIANMNGYYTEEEFVIVLPQRLVIGLNFLFVAVVTTMVAFIGALSLFLEDRFKNFTTIIWSLASIPFLISVMLLLPSTTVELLYKKLYDPKKGSI